MGADQSKGAAGGKPSAAEAAAASVDLAARKLSAAAEGAGVAARKRLNTLTSNMTFMSQYGFVTGGTEAEDSEEEDEDGDEDEDEDVEDSESAGELSTPSASPKKKKERAPASPPPLPGSPSVEARKEAKKKAAKVLSEAAAAKKKTTKKKAAADKKEATKKKKKKASSSPKKPKKKLISLSWAATERLASKRRSTSAGDGAAAAAPPPQRRAPDRRASRRGGVIKFEDAAEVERKKKLDMVVEEIQASERLYHKFLTIMVDKFIVPLRAEGVLDADQLQRVFSNIEEIVPYHAQIAEELETEDPASVFLAHADELRGYTPYVNNYDRACECVAALKRDARFQAFLEARRGDEECGGLDIMSFLIMPVQRIPRYNLLLLELRKRTLETDENYAVLGRALARIQSTCQFVNEAKRQAENKSRLIEIQNRVTGDYDNLLQPHRTLMREAPILRKKKSSKEVHLFLFSDILMWTSAAPRYEFQGVLNLATATLADYEHKTKIGFVLESPALEDDGGRLVFVCRNRAHKRLWTDPLEKVLEKARGFLMRSRNMSENRRRGRNSHRSSITMSSGTLAAVAQIEEEKEAALAAVDGDAPDADEQRRESILAATERLKNLGLGDAGKVDESLQPKH